MKIDILTIFPEMFKGPFDYSIIGRAREEGIVDIKTYDLRNWTQDKHKTVDGKPYGGGAGMVMKIEPIYKALEELDCDRKARRILLTAKGERIVQGKVRELSKLEYIILICGHYEGVDHRVHDFLVDETISIGDFVLTGGEIPAMALTDAIVRLVPGVVGNEDSIKDESFSNSSQTESFKPKAKSYLEYPQYTRPAVFETEEGKKLKVPEVLLSGDHGKIEKWRKKMKKAVK